MKRSLLFLFLIPFFATAQQGKLVIQGSTGNLYLKHTAAPKENFYSIGRLYNISPKEFAPYNNLALEKGLSLGKEIKIPLTGNFTQSPVTAADEVAVPLYHKAEPKETLTQISARYNKVSLSELRTWNNLGSDALKPGQELIVGYLKVKKDLSPLAVNGTTVAAVKVEKETLTDPPTKKTNIPVAATPVDVAPARETPMMKVNPTVEKKKAIIEDKPVVQKKDVKEGAGVFKAQFAGSGLEQSGMAGIFKSTSGREDGKYYCLQNTIPPGTVIRVTNPANGKSIYAKVLDMMPDLKKNEGLALLLSDAAADALGVENNFNCTINY